MNVKAQNSILINFIGIGCEVYKIQVTEKQLKKMDYVAEILGLPVHLAIFDGNFFTLLKDEKWNCLNDLKNEFCERGLIDGYNNFIEILVNTKRMIIKHFDLWNDYNLFPAYNLKVTESKFKVSGIKFISIVETSYGIIKSFRINTNNFYLDKLTIHINKTEISDGNLQPIITGVKYHNRNPSLLLKKLPILNRMAIIE